MMGPTRAIVVIVSLLFVAGCGASSANTENFSAGTRGTTPAAEAKLKKPFICPTGKPDTLEVLEPVTWPREARRWRWGADAKKFSDVRSSKSVPVERCGARDSYEYLADLRCDDNTHPFENATDVQPARVGDVGKGGACDFIIDQYEVECPEETYKIYIDPYHCPEGESM